jgi:CBS domain containing-hemolysin-like protein
MTDDYTLSVLVIGLLILANAFFVAAEFALVRVRRTRIDTLISEGIASAKVVREQLDQVDDYISATQVGVTLASLALGAIGEPFFAGLFDRLFSVILPEHLVHTSKALSHGAAVAIGFFAITFMHVVIGELTPKSLALQFPEKMTLYVARPLRFIKVLFSPLVWLLRGSSIKLLRLFGAKSMSSHSLALSEEELLMLLAESKKAGVVSEDEQRMLQRVFKFHDKTVREIMVPRPDIAALHLRATEDEIKRVFEQGYSRLPVWDTNLNNIKGIVYVKDLIYTLQNPKLIKLVDLIREVHFVPETQPVSVLLRELQKRRLHMAIVVDEFGDTAGLVTLEDVIEEIVGEIQDEYDSEPAEVQRAPDGWVVFDGKTAADRFREIFPTFNMPEGSYETVAGLVFQLAGRVPKEAELLRHDGFLFKIAKREGRRLKKIAVMREPKPAAIAETPSESHDTAMIEKAVESLPPVAESTRMALADLPPVEEPPPEESHHGEVSEEPPEETKETPKSEEKKYVSPARGRAVVFPHDPSSPRR